MVAGDAGVVDEDVDLAELGEGLFDSGLDLVFVGYVDNEGGGLASGGGDGGDEFVELLAVAGGGGDGRAFAGEGQGAGVADALGRSGDQRYAACEFHGCSSSELELEISVRTWGTISGTLDYKRRGDKDVGNELRG